MGENYYDYLKAYGDYMEPCPFPLPRDNSLKHIPDPQNVREVQQVHPVCDATLCVSPYEYMPSPEYRHRRPGYYD